ncbi:DUF5134 domain-containing protein [Actinocorallia cavernae]|uniref:DUF5134 domain-containing protein n=2 Tax=Actinomycetes TaxID=1760 RepID=A0ABP5YTI9_9ACTN
MIAAGGLRWILTLLFAVPTVYGLWRTVRPGAEPAVRVDHGLHAVMGALMIAMAWPWGMDLPSTPQVVLFSLGAVWFLAGIPFRAGGRRTSSAARALLPHVVMMGAMAWMVAAMASSGTMSGGSGTGGGHDMAGMDMSGGTGIASMTLDGTGPKATAVLLAVVLAAFGLLWLSRALDGAKARDLTSVPAPGGSDPVERRPVGALDPACHAAMALAMAVMFVVLV